MTRKDFNDLRAEILAHAQSINDAKGPDYAHDDGNADALYNFKTVGERLGVDPMIVWGVYFEKHVVALERYVKTRRLTSEKLVDRVADLVNYLLLGYALAYEEHETPKPEPKWKPLSQCSDLTLVEKSFARELDEYNLKKYRNQTTIEDSAEIIALR